MRCILFFIFLVAALFATCGCSDRYIKANTVTQAVPLTPEKLEEISRNIFESTGPDSSASVESDIIPTETLPPPSDDSTVFWLVGGKVCHVSQDCRYIRDREDTLTSTLAEARMAGKEKVCSVCYPTSE